MRPVLDRDHDLLGEDEPSNDLVLGAPALLGIFFALALICAVFFGFGYSSGHGLHLPGSSPTPQSATAPQDSHEPSQSANSSVAAPAVTTPDAPAPQDSEVATAEQPLAARTAAKPSPDIASFEAPGFPPSTASAATRAAKPSAGQLSNSVAGSASASGSLTYRSTTAPTAAALLPHAAPNQLAANTAQMPGSLPALPGASTVAGSPVSLMVQIAAVSRAADAETLATALRHDGFPALVRTSTTDAFFHVQIGPFASRDAAKAMRARLADSGYNAFIKQ